jgi:hypothetical protein
MPLRLFLCKETILPPTPARHQWHSAVRDGPAARKWPLERGATTPSISRRPTCSGEGEGKARPFN